MANIFGDYTKVNSKRIEAIVNSVNDRALECRNITTDQTRVNIDNNGTAIIGTREQQAFIDKTNEFRRRLRDGETLDDIMVEALAVVREAIRRKTGMFPYDTQIEASVSMLGQRLSGEDRERVIAEMKTGEGKTLVQILVAYLDVLQATKDKDKMNWSSVHVMTSNDALAKRDQMSNSKVFTLLGISSGFVPSRSATRTTNPTMIMINKKKKQLAYASDIVYATAQTIAFDYSEDNTLYDPRNKNIVRTMGYAIVDEADDILIDQAINPLKLSQRPRENGSEYERLVIARENSKNALYKWATDFLYGKTRIAPLIGKIYDQYFDNKDKPLEGEDYKYYKDTQQIVLSDRIQEEIGADLSDSDKDTEIFNARYCALLDCIKAKESFHADVEYRVEVKDGKGRIVLIDQNIGRKKYETKYVGGMHQAIEAKEEFLENEAYGSKKRYHVDFTRGLIVKARCTYPDFLSVYKYHVCGMTGTSDEEEFKKLYGLDTYRVRTRKRNIRIDEESELYATLNEKYNAILETVKKCVSTGEPVLIGTTSLKESLIISSLLKKNLIRHQLLNADNEEEESQIIAGAGMMGTVTVATNMAGRGTDIKLGPGVRELGGLFVIGTSRNKSERIDRQLMGRSGRQGDPGRTKCYSSLEDDLVKEYYRGSALDGIINMYKGTNEPIRNKKIIEAAKRTQEARENRDKTIRLDNEKFNAVYAKQRTIIYDNRNQVLNTNLFEFIKMVKGIIDRYSEILVKNYRKEEIEKLIGHIVDVDSLYDKKDSVFTANIAASLAAKFRSNFPASGITDDDVIKVVAGVKKTFLDIIDYYWLGHIEYLEGLRLNVSFSAGSDPFKDYDSKSASMFGRELIPAMYNEMITYACNPNMEYGTYEMKSAHREDEGKLLI